MSKNIDTDICPECMEEPCVCGGNHINEAWKIEAIPSHKIGVTVSDPKHTMVSKRSEQIQKRVIVKSHTKEGAVEKAKEFYKKRGYKVHDAFHHSIMPATSMKVDEAMDPREKELLTVTSGTRSAKLDEVSDEKLKSYVKGAMHDTITGKKDRNPGMKKAFNRLAGLNKAMGVEEAYTPSPEEQHKIAQGWAKKHPNIDKDVADAEHLANRHANYEYASGRAYADGKAAHEKLHYLKAVKKLIDSSKTKKPVKEEVEQIDYLLEYPEDLQKMKKADSYKVGDKVFTKVGGKWHKGHVTTPLNKAGNHGVKFQHGGKTHSYVSSPDQLRLHVEEAVAEGQLDELSRETLKSYHKKAVDQLTKGDVLTKKFDRRESGAIKAFKKAYDQKDKQQGVAEEKQRLDTEMKNDKQPVKEESDPPFDKPYTKVTRKPVVDKSGAKHGPMSFAKHLARRGAQQASGNTSKGTYHTITKPDIRNPNGPGKKIKVFVPVKEQARAIDDSPETGLNLGKVKTFSKFDKVTATSRPMAKNHNEEINIDTSLLELYLKLSDENKIHMMEMFDNGMKDLLVDFISKESE